MIIDTVFIDFEKFQERVGVLEEVMLELIDHYFSQIDERTERIADGIKTDDFDLITQTAHSVKNDISQFDATLLYKNAIEIENAARNKDMDTILLHFNRFPKYHKELKVELSEIKKWLEQIY